MQSHGNSLYTIDHNFTVGAAHIGCRTTAVKLSDGKVWLHSPGDLSEEHVNQINSLGEVGYIIAPNMWHHVYVEQTQAHFPSAKTLHAPELDSKQEKLNFDGQILDDKSFSSDFDMLLVEGMPQFNEIVFLHKPSRTLIVSDLIFNMQKPKGIVTKIMTTLFGTNGRTAVSRLFLSFVKDRGSFSDSVKAVARWDFDRIVMAHGEVITANAKDTFLSVCKAYL